VSGELDIYFLLRYWLLVIRYSISS